MSEVQSLRLPLALVGLGKIALDQHVPTLRSSPDFELVAVASRSRTLPELRCYADTASLLAAEPDVRAIAFCTPPGVRDAAVRLALERGCHVLLEKPPGGRVGEVEAWQAIARRRGVTLNAAWHSRHAAAVPAAATWLSGRTIRSIAVTWHEDAAVWHAGQEWLWQAGGFGAFDPGINALSILGVIIPGALAFEDAELRCRDGDAMPAAAQVTLRACNGAPVRLDLDILHSGFPVWTIDVVTDAGTLSLSDGGHRLRIAGRPIAVEPCAEYAGVYAHFATQIREHRCDVETAPLALVCEALARGHRADG